MAKRYRGVWRYVRPTANGYFPEPQTMVITLPAGNSPEGLSLATVLPGGVCVLETVNPSPSSTRSAWGQFMPVTSGTGTRPGVLAAGVLGGGGVGGGGAAGRGRA